MTPLSPAQRVDALAARGIMLYVDANGKLRARCEPCFAPLLSAALPMIAWNRKEIASYLLGSDTAKSRSPGLAGGISPTVAPQ